MGAGQELGRTRGNNQTYGGRAVTRQRDAAITRHMGAEQLPGRDTRQ
jgi:hypothetical protein